MRRPLTLIAAALTVPLLGACVADEEAGAWNYEEHVAKRQAEIDASPVEAGGVLFVGDSITEAGDWSAAFPGLATSNQGVAGDRTDAVLARMDQVARGTPERVFLMIGTNDLSGLGAEEAAAGAVAVAREIRTRLPDADLYVQSVLPRERSKVSDVAMVNERLASEADRLGYTYLDIHDRFAAPDGTLRAELTYDDLHLNDQGYALWAETIEACVREGCDGV